MVCPSWSSSGRCQYGSTCHNLHDPAPDRYIKPSGVKYKPCTAQNSFDGICRLKGCHFKHHPVARAAKHEDPSDKFRAFLSKAGERQLEDRLTKIWKTTVDATGVKAPDMSFCQPELYVRHPMEYIIAVDQKETKYHDDAFSCYFDSKTNEYVLSLFVADAASVVATAGDGEWAEAMSIQQAVYAMPHTSRRPLSKDRMQECRLQVRFEGEPRPTVVGTIRVSADGVGEPSVFFSHALVTIDELLCVADAHSLIAKLTNRSQGMAAVSGSEEAAETLRNVYKAIHRLREDTIHLDYTYWSPSNRQSYSLLTDLSLVVSYSDPTTTGELMARSLKHLVDDKALAFCRERGCGNSLLFQTNTLDDTDFEWLRSTFEHLQLPQENDGSAFDMALRKWSHGWFSLNDAMRAKEGPGVGMYRHLDPTSQAQTSTARSPFTRPFRDFVAMHNQANLLCAIYQRGRNCPAVFHPTVCKQISQCRQLIATVDVEKGRALLLPGGHYAGPHQPNCGLSLVGPGVCLPGGTHVLLSPPFPHYGKRKLQQPLREDDEGTIVSVTVEIPDKGPRVYRLSRPDDVPKASPV